MHAIEHDLLTGDSQRRLVVAAGAARPALAVAAGLAPAGVFVFLGAADVGLAPLGDCLAGECRALRQVDDRVDRARIVDLVMRNRRGVGDAGTRVREHLPFEAGLRHAGAEQFRHPCVLVADQALDVFPFRMCRVGRRIQRIERDVARAAGRADQERRLVGRIGQPADALIRRGIGLLDQRLVEHRPVRKTAVELLPALCIEARVGELAQAERAGRGAELQVARRVPLIDLAAPGVRVVGIERGILQAARRIDVARLADVLEQHVIAGAPVEAVSLFAALGRAIGVAGLAARRVVDDAPRPEAVVALVGTQHAVPVDQHADALLERVGVEARVAGGGLEPDQPSDAFRFVQAFARAGFEVRGILIDAGFLRHRLGGARGVCAGCWRCRLGPGNAAGRVVSAEPHPGSQYRTQRKRANRVFVHGRLPNR